MAVNMAPQGSLPMPVQQAAMAQQLGAFMKGYKATLVRMILGTIVFAALGLFFVALAINTSGDGSGIAIGGVLGLLSFGLTAFFIYRIVQAAGQQIYLFQQGIVIEHKGQVQAFPWNQATEVWQSITRHYTNGVYTGTTYQYTLQRGDGYKIKLDNTTKGIAELGQAVTRGITQELVPRAMNSIRAGQTLTFGRFSVNQQGIGNGKEFIPWPQVQAVNVNRGQVTVKKAGKFLNWGSAMVAKIPNFFVFLAVSEEMIRQVSGGRQGY